MSKPITRWLKKTLVEAAYGERLSAEDWRPTAPF